MNIVARYSSDEAVSATFFWSAENALNIGQISEFKAVLGHLTQLKAQIDHRAKHILDRPKPEAPKVTKKKKPQASSKSQRQAPEPVVRLQKAQQQTAQRQLIQIHEKLFAKA